MDTLELPRTAGHRIDGAERVALHDRGARPRSRPPRELRAMIGLLAVVAIAAIGALMLSDRAPGALHAVLGDAVDRLSARIDTGGRLPPRDRLPESDFVVHLGLWATATVLAGWTVWSWRWLVLSTATVLAVSVVVEGAQGRWSDTRQVEAIDVAANALGIGIGAGVVAACYLIWSGIAMAITAGRRR